MTNFLLIGIGFLLVLLNAFFVAAEFGMVKLRYTRVSAIEQEYPWRGSILAKVHQHLDAYLSACQLGITLASLGLGWIGEPAFASVIKPFLSVMGLHSPAMIEFIGFTLAFTLLSFLHIVVGELMPKSLAIRQSEQISLWTAAPLYAFYWLMYPAIWLLNSCSNFLLRLLKLDETHPGEQSHTPEEIKLILRSSQLHGELTQQESSILSQTLTLTDLSAMDVMRSYDEMVRLDDVQEKKILLGILSHYRYSRYPVYSVADQTIIGLVHVKDLQPILHAHKDTDMIDLKTITREIPRVSYRMPILSLLRQFQEGMPHFALVLNRQGMIVGYVTLDNLLHLVIGGIKDEFHKTRDAWVSHKDGSLTVRGDCPLNALERALNQELLLDDDEEEEIATLAGLIMHRLGSVPKKGEIIDFEQFTAEIEKMQGARIMQVRIKAKEIPTTSDD